jgi:hypothetical protein
MHAIDVVGPTRGGHPVTGRDPPAGRDLDRGQVAEGDTQPTTEVGGDAEPAGNGPGEGDDPRAGSHDRRSLDGGEVDAPMTGIAADGGEAGKNRTRHRGEQPGAIERRPQRHGEEHDGERGVAYRRDRAIEQCEWCPAHPRLPRHHRGDTLSGGSDRK